MAAIQVLSTDTIKAPNSTDEKIDLTPWDLKVLLVEPTQKGLLYHHPLESNQIQHLKHTLSSALAFFPPLSGRLEITDHKDNTMSCSVTCNNAGVLFVHAATENTCVGDILGCTYVPPILHSFFPLNGVKNYEGTSQPLFAVQVTELVDGIFIGFTFNHVVVDGTSAWYFINSWAEISRGGCCNQISKLSTLERWFPDGIQRPIRFPFTEKLQKNKSDGLSFSSSNNEKLNPTARLFHFTKEKISQLKLKANLETGTNKISSLQALFAHLWCSVIRSDQLDPQENVYFMVGIGARQRFVPPLPEDYFGNAVVASTVAMKVGELLEEGGLGKCASKMHQTISLHSNEKLKNDYKNWVRNPIIFRLGNNSNVADYHVLASSSSQWFDVYGNDFGWGKPVAVRSGNNLSGLVAVFAGIEEGSMDIQVCLPHKILEAMGNDSVFMEFVSN